MLIMSRVCADFYDKRRNLIFSITPATRLTFLEAPAAIQEDPLFKLLIAEGSLEANLTPAVRKELELDPLQGVDASGKKIQPPESGVGPEKEGISAAVEDVGDLTVNQDQTDPALKEDSPVSTPKTAKPKTKTTAKATDKTGEKAGNL